MSHFTEWKRDGCDVFKEKVTANRGGEGMKLMADGRKPQCVWLGGRRHWAVSSLKLIFFFFFHWERACTEQMECRAGDGGADEDPHFDKLRFGEPHGCYETHSVFKGRLKRSLDHSFETVPGTVRHWRQAHTQTRREIRSGETRLRRTSGTFRRDSPLFRDLKFPMNLTYSYTGGSLGSMVPLSMWQQNSSWFFAGVKKKKKERMRNQICRMMAKMRRRRRKVSSTFQIFGRQRLSFHDVGGQSLVHVWVLPGWQEVQQVLVHEIRLKDAKQQPTNFKCEEITNIPQTQTSSWDLFISLFIYYQHSAAVWCSKTKRCVLLIQWGK